MNIDAFVGLSVTVYLNSQSLVKTGTLNAKDTTKNAYSISVPAPSGIGAHASTFWFIAQDVLAIEVKN